MPTGPSTRGSLPSTSQKNGAQKLERELANRPLFIDGGVSNRWLRIKPSGVQQRKTARAIIKHYKDQNPKQRMRKDDFIKAVVDQLPGLSREQAKKLWRDNAPAAWKRPGTKKGH